MSVKEKIIAVVGPTASGKSALGSYLAQKLGGEVISADSRQIYKGMHVISRAEKGHMVGIADPKRQFSAGEYAKEAQKICFSILQKTRIPIVVGGSGFYTEALLRAPLPEVPPDKKLRARLAKKTIPQLFAQLKKLNPARAAQVDPYNKVRLIRAIEISKATRRSIASAGALRAARPSLTPATGNTTPPFHTLWLGLPKPKNYKQILYVGVEERLRRGMIAEAKKLRKTLSKKRYGELGFEFDLIADYLDKIGPRPTRHGREIAREELIEKLVRGERTYALRQMRWFKRNKDIQWIKNKSEALRLSKKFLSR